MYIRKEILSRIDTDLQKLNTKKIKLIISKRDDDLNRLLPNKEARIANIYIFNVLNHQANANFREVHMDIKIFGSI